MDHPPSPNQIDLSDATSKNNEALQAGGSSDPEDHPEGQANPGDQEPPQPYIEFGCKYCTKKFSSKQALGGHYNAHKAERALEKAARELHDIRFSLYNNGGGSGGAGPSAAPAYIPRPYLGPYFRSHDIVDRPVFNHFPYDNNPHQQAIHFDFNPDPRLPLASVPNAPGQRFHQFLGHGAYFVRNPGPHIWYPNIGTSSARARPVDPDLSAFAAPRNDPLDEDESGLDLSLKL